MSLTTYRNIVLLACLAGTSVVYGQRVSFGLEEGITTLDPTQRSPDDSRRYVLGAALEASLWRGLAVETDFLYRRNGYGYSFNYPASIPGGPDSTAELIHTHAQLDVFELPVLAKYYFRGNSKLQPFVLSGYSLRKALVNVDSRVNSVSGASVSTQAYSSSEWTSIDVGASFGAGLRWRTGRIALKPELRYTYWGAHPNAGLSKNQLDVLVGIMF